MCAVVGKEEGVTGKFEVESMCFPGLPQPLPRDLPQDDKYEVFILYVCLE